MPARTPAARRSTRRAPGRDRCAGVPCRGCGTPSASIGRVAAVSPAVSVASTSGAVAVGSAWSALLGVLVMLCGGAEWFVFSVRCVSFPRGQLAWLSGFPVVSRSDLPPGGGAGTHQPPAAPRRSTSSWRHEVMGSGAALEAGWGIPPEPLNVAVLGCSVLVCLTGVVCLVAGRSGGSGPGWGVACALAKW